MIYPLLVNSVQNEFYFILVLYATWHNGGVIQRRLTGSSQVLDLRRDLDVGLRGQCEAASLAYAIAHQGDVLLEAGGVVGEAQHGAPCLGQRCGLVLGAP